MQETGINAGIGFGVFAKKKNRSLYFGFYRRGDGINFVFPFRESKAIKPLTFARLVFCFSNHLQK